MFKSAPFPTFLNYLWPFKNQDYVPKSIACLREGYNPSLFWNDLFAGISVGIIALPLALAFAIASDVSPERGLFTAIIAGFLISLLGGSRVQIGGPTGAFVIIVYGIIQRHGYEGLAIATLIGGALMVIMGLARCGILLKFIPYPVTTGFTTGIALIIFTGQIKDFFGLRPERIPPEFLDKCKILCQFAHTWNVWALLIAVGSLVLIASLRRAFPRFPGVLFAIICATAITYFFELPIETIAAKFGEIPRTLPTPSIPTLSWERIQTLFPEAITIALLGSIESLLSAVVADGATGHRHRSNCELVAQGLANMGSVVFGGIPATGAIARTSANIRLGAKTPMAGMIHAITLLLLMLLLAPLAGMIPLAALSAVLVFVAWNMSELPHFWGILKNSKTDALILLTTFLLTVLIDLTVAIQVGVVLSAMLFLKSMTDVTSVKICQILVKENTHQPAEQSDGEILFRTDVPEDVAVFEIKGPFFYSIADLLQDALNQLQPAPRVFILRLRHVSLIDSTGMKALRQFAKTCKQKNIVLLLSGVHGGLADLLHQGGVEEILGPQQIFPHINAALAYARKAIPSTSIPT